ncbi:MAG: TRAP transporter small permease [Firmicutes bacterium]|jgi:TRAP-type C4-dicarboxylate transport system permease small subunit|nr:TRAP transporter small permease [Bacillota bacterium]MBQ1690174.1 TRAP transporter small permease [Bacillota bacterium]MBR2748971.1 TRAP transporter small permease [Bacillota bacterium]
MKNKLLYVWDHFEEILLVPALAFSTILIFAQVCTRAFGNSISWSEELVRYLYVWETWLGVSYATKRGSQLRITMIRDKLSPKGQMAIEIFVTIVWLAFAAFVFYMGVRAIGQIAKFGQVSSALRVPLKYCYLSIPVGMAMMSVRLIESSIKRFRPAKEGGDK